MSEEIKDFIREQNEEQSKKLLKEVKKIVGEGFSNSEKRLEARLDKSLSASLGDIIEKRVSAAEENIAISVNKTFQRIDDGLYAFRREHASGMKKFEERLDNMNNFISNLYDNHERRIKTLEAY